MSTLTRDRLTPTARLGTAPEPGTAPGAAGLLSQAGLLGWNVRTVPVSASEITDTGVTGFELPRSAATVFSNPATGKTDAIGVVGRAYRPIQNEEMIPFLDALETESGGHFYAAGHDRSHAHVFFGIKTPTVLEIGGFDKVGVNIMVSNTHDGSGAFAARCELIRLICTNGLTAVIPGTRTGISVRHTSRAGDAIREAIRSLDTMSTYVGAFTKTVEPLLSQKFVDEAFAQIVASLLPVTAEENPHVSAVLNLRHSSETIQDEVRSTSWGAYQAFTEYVDHLMPVRTSGDRVAARAHRSMGSGMARTKSRMLAALI